MYLQGSIFLSPPPMTTKSGNYDLTDKKHTIGPKCQFSTECAAKNPDSLLNHIYKY